MTISLHQDSNCDGLADGLLLSQDSAADGQFVFTGLQVGPIGDPVCYVLDVDETDMGCCWFCITSASYRVRLDSSSPEDLDSDFGFVVSIGGIVDPVNPSELGITPGQAQCRGTNNVVVTLLVGVALVLAAGGVLTVKRRRTQ